MQPIQPCTTPMEDRQTIVEAAKSLYDDSLPYHNYQHVQNVLSASEVILQKCRQESVKVDECVVFYALLFHDAGYREDHLAKGFDSKEAYSAYLAGRVLSEQGLAADTIARVKSAIICTHYDHACVSNEDKVVKNSDLYGLSSDYSQFKQASLDLMCEYNLMHDTQIHWDEWKHMAAKRVEKYLDASMFLTSDAFDEHGQSIFITAARNNIQQLLADSE